MTKINFLVPVVCTDSARVEVDIPDKLLPKFRKFLTSNPSISWSSLEQFLADNDLQNDNENVDINDRISEACNKFDSENLYWESSGYGAVDFENDDFTTFDNDRDWLLKALSEVRENGRVNMLDKSAVCVDMFNFGYEEESQTLNDMNNKDYVQLLTKDLPQWLEI